MGTILHGLGRVDEAITWFDEATTTREIHAFCVAEDPDL